MQTELRLGLIRALNGQKIAGGLANDILAAVDKQDVCDHADDCCAKVCKRDSACICTCVCKCTKDYPDCPAGNYGQKCQWRFAETTFTGRVFYCVWCLAIRVVKP